MDLWIKSQNKEILIKTTDIRFNRKKDDYSILGYGDAGVYRLLGVYKTKERALEVLDEINTIKYYKYMASLDWKTFASSVLKPKPMEEQKLMLSMMNTYQMPEE